MKKTILRLQNEVKNFLQEKVFLKPHCLLTNPAPDPGKPATYHPEVFLNKSSQFKFTVTEQI